MSDTFKAALDAALQFHGSAQAGVDPEEIIGTAKRFHQELVNAAPGAAEDWDESWFSRVGTWLAALSGDQLGSVRGQLANLERSRQPLMVAQPPSYAYYQSAPPIPMPGMPAADQPAPKVSEAWALLDKLNGPQPYPGTAAPIGPLVTRDELDRELAKLGCDPRCEGDVTAAATPWRDRTLAPEPAAISEALERQDDETILAAAERVAKERDVWEVRAERAEAALRNATFALPDSERARPAEGPALVAGDTIRVRPLGADVWVSTTVTAEVTYSPTEGFVTFVPAGAFSEATKDQISTESVDALLKLLVPAKLRGTVTQQVKELVGTVQGQAKRIEQLEKSHETFESAIRETVDAAPEVEDDDSYHPAEPTLGAVDRVVRERDGAVRALAALAAAMPGKED